MKNSNAGAEGGAAAVPFEVIIPARMAATRLPGKPLLLLAGRPLIAHVVARAFESAARSVIVATDDERIAVAAAAAGAEVEMTGIQHASGTDRLAEVTLRRGLDAERIIVNLQGDEPLMPPALINAVAATLAGDVLAAAASVCTPIHAQTEVTDPNVVKVVLGAESQALYFSRAPIPWWRAGFPERGCEAAPEALWYRHIGLYAYRAGFLARYASLPTAPLERLESLEQLRILHAGLRISMAITDAAPAVGVDTPADFARVAALLESGI